MNKRNNYNGAPQQNHSAQTQQKTAKCSHQLRSKHTMLKPNIEIPSLVQEDDQCEH